MKERLAQPRGWQVLGGAVVVTLFVGWQARPPPVPAESLALADVQRCRLLSAPARRPAPRAVACDVLVAGGGLGGVAAALGACEAGRSVVLTEETDWLGGQISSQGVAALDEHRYMEKFGGTRLYYQLRIAIRSFYARNYQLSPAISDPGRLNPGGAWVSQLAFQPWVGALAIDTLLQPYRARQQLRVFRRFKPVGADVQGNRVLALTLRHLDSASYLRVRARYFLDATELGDLLPFVGAEYRFGAESRQQTGEPSARPDQPRLDCSQSFAYPFALELARTPSTPVNAPPGYEGFRRRQPYTLAPDDRSDSPGIFRMFRRGERTPGSFWTYRRALAAENFDDPRARNDIAIILFAGNDYRWNRVIDQPPDRLLAALKEAKRVALGFAHWLQCDLPRDEGGHGYRELRLRPDELGSVDGFSKFPYIREARRILSMRQVREQDIALRYCPQARATLFADSVGIGWHAIDLHPGACGDAWGAQPTRPFQLPLGALVPLKMENLLPAGKTLGTTHITNGAYRVHPVEWNVGEVAGRLAAFCIQRGLTPRQVAEQALERRRFQICLVTAGIPVFWFVDTPLEHRAFASSQLLAVWGAWPITRGNLEFQPDRPIGRSAAMALLGHARLPAQTATRILAQAGFSAPGRTVLQGDFACAWLAAVRPADAVSARNGR